MADRTAPQIVRSLVLNALDLFADKVKPALDETQSTPLQRLASQWKSLDAHDRDAVVDKIGVVTEVIAAAIPLAVAATRARAARKRAARENDDESDTKPKKGGKKARNRGSAR